MSFQVDNGLMYKLQAVLDEYDRRCDAYDDVICSAHNGRCSMPANGREMTLINKHAVGFRQEIMARYSITPKQFQKAMSYRRR